MVDAVGTSVFNYTSAGQLLTEDGPFASDTVTNTYWNRMRVGMNLQQPTGLWTNAFGYDPARRLWDVTSPAGEFDYQYQDSSPSTLVQKLLLPNTSYITNIYDGNARLLGTWLKNSGDTNLDQQAYGYNAGNQRVQWTNSSSEFALYSYDRIGQLTIASNNVAGERRGYAYDMAWNLNYRTNNTTSQTFTVDGLNELTNAPDGSCTYDSNGNLVSAGGGTWGYTYDDENRLLTVTSNNVATGYTATETLFYYDGQGRLRRRLELHNIVADGGDGTGGGETDSVGFVGGDVDSVGGGGGITWMTNSETLYIYDGKRVIQERNGSNTPLVSYTRGSDLSGSLEGAGGIGGLLARTDNTMLPSTNAHAFYHADGNGNITYLVNNSQSYAAIYQYDPFGNMVYSFGALADANTYRFSSKEFIPSVGLYYYLYRFYSPSSQRWVNRDPIGEAGFRQSVIVSLDNWNDQANAYRFVANDPNFGIDAEGLTVYVCSRKTEWGVGNHTYFYNSSPPPGGCSSCGTSGSSGGSSSGSSSSCNKSPCPDDNEKGPPKGPNGPDGDTCQPIPDSDGRAGQSIMDDCKNNANNGIYFPCVHDCHNSVNNTLRRNGYRPPPNHRFGRPHVGSIRPK